MCEWSGRLCQTPGRSKWLAFVLQSWVMSAPLVNWNYDKLKRSSSLIEVSFLSLVLFARPTESSESTLRPALRFFFFMRVDENLWFLFVGQHHEESGNLDYKLQLEIWKGNLGGALEMATKSKQLNDWLVALSPLGNTVFLSYIICVHSKHNLTISISAQQQQQPLFPYGKKI